MNNEIMKCESPRTKLSVQDMVQLSVLIAIMLLLELTGLGMIKTAGLEITIMLVPVIVGAIVMGPAAGALLGGVFGLISFWECFGKSSFGVVLLGINPIYTFLVCVPTRIRRAGSAVWHSRPSARWIRAACGLSAPPACAARCATPCSS